MRICSILADDKRSHVELTSECNHACSCRGWFSPLWSMGVNALRDSEECVFDPKSHELLVVDSCIAMFYLLGISLSACTFSRNLYIVNNNEFLISRLHYEANPPFQRMHESGCNMHYSWPLEGSRAKHEKLYLIGLKLVLFSWQRIKFNFIPMERIFN